MVKKNTNLVKFLEKYTYKFPGVQPGTSKRKKPQTPKTKAKAKIKQIKKKITPTSNLSERKSLLSEITPEIKAVVADNARSFFTKFIDPSYEKIVLQTENSSCNLSIDVIYDDILSKFNISQIIDLAKNPGLDVPEVSNIISSNIPGIPKINIPDPPKVNFNFPDLDKIADVTQSAADASLGDVKKTIGSMLGCMLTDILRSIKKSITKASEVDESYGAIMTDSLMDEEQFLALSNSLSSLSNTPISQIDIKKILQIISINSTPSELIQIFEGNGDLEVIETIGSEILLAFPILLPILETVYEVEEFLMLIGGVVLDDLKKRSEEAKIEKLRNLVYSNFCTPDQEEIFDYISGRFPEELTRDQILREKTNREQFLEYLNELESSINTNLKKFIFGDKLDEMLDFTANDPSNDLLIQTIVKSFFNPVNKIFNVESSDIKSLFLSRRIVAGAGKTVAFQYSDTDDNASKPSNFRVFTGAHRALKDLKEEFRNENNFLGRRWQDNILRFQFYFDISNKNTFFTISYSPIEPVYDLGDAPTNAASEAWLDGSDIEPPKTNIKMETSFFDKGGYVFSHERIIKVENTKMFNLISKDDVGLTPRASAYGNFVKGILEDYPNISISGKNKDNFVDLIEILKGEIFPTKNQNLIRYLAHLVSKSPLFGLKAISKINFSSTDPNKSFMSMEDFKKNISKKRRYFEFLEKSSNERFNDRTPLENALLMEVVDTTFKIYAIETLLGGMYVYNDISLKSIKENYNVFEIVKNTMLEEMKFLGPGYDVKFLDFLTQYAAARSNLPKNNNIMSPMPVFDSDTQVEEIMCFLISEQIEKNYDKFQNFIKKATPEQKLEENEFFDIIPYINTPKSSVSDELLTDLAHGQKNADLITDLVSRDGGFILERYVRTDFRPKFYSVSTQELADLIFLWPRILYKTLNTDADKDKYLLKDQVPRFMVDVAQYTGFDKYKSDWEDQQPELPEFGYYSRGNLDGVVSQETFEKLQDDVKKYNMEVDPSYYVALENLMELKSKKEEGQELSEEFLQAEKRYMIHANLMFELIREVKKKFKEADQFFLKIRVNDPFYKSLSEEEKNKIWTDQSLVQEGWLSETYQNGTVFRDIHDAVDNGKGATPPIEQYIAQYEFDTILPFIKAENMTNPDKFRAADLLEKAINTGSPHGVTTFESLISTKNNQELLIFIKEFSWADAATEALQEKYSENMLENTINQLEHYVDGVRRNIFFIEKQIKFYENKAGEIVQQKKASLEKELEQYENILSWFEEETLYKEIKWNYETNLKDLKWVQKKLKNKVGITALYDKELAFLQQKYDQVIAHGNLIHGPYTNYFSSIKYGLRLSYLLPVDEESYPDGQEENFTKAKDIISNITEGPNSAINYKDKMFIKVLQSPPGDTKTAYKETLTESGVGSDIFIPTQERYLKKYYSIPLFTAEDEVAKYFNEENPPHIGDKTIWKMYPQAYQNLRKQISNSDEYKMLISEILLFGDIVSTLGAYSSVFVKKEVFNNMLGSYSGTKLNLRNIFSSLLDDKDLNYFNPNTPHFDGVVENLSKINNPADDPVPGSNFLKGAFGYASLFASKTALKILKGVVETTDPAIIAGKIKQDKLILAAQTAARASAIANGISPEAIPVEELEKASDIVGSEAVLAALTLAPGPFPLGPTVITPITPEGMTYLSLATAAEAFKAALEEID